MTDQATHEALADDAAWLPQVGENEAGKYEVERVLGHGGMGVVVAARHAQLGNRVAIKYLRPDLVQEPSAMARFLREAKAAVALRGEHVARVQDVGTLDSGAPFMIMEFLTGTDLDAVLDDQGALPVDQAIEYVLQACEALAEAHVAGLVHRDLKPGNLCLTQRPDGSPLIKVLDFGIAKAIEPAGEQPSNLTQTGTALGTPMYMSPEQVRDAKAVDPRSDIWALGTVLYQLVVGEPPFVAETLPSLCAKIVADPAPELARQRPDAPAGLSAVVSRCLEKAPENRFQDVGELAQALSPWAPARARVHVERIVRIVGGQGAKLPHDAADSGSWRAMDSVAATMAASTGSDVVTAPLLAGVEGVEAAAPVAGARAGADPAKQTAAAWQTRTGSPAADGAVAPARARATVLVAAVAVVALAAAGLLWGLADGSPSESAAAETTVPIVPAVATDEPVAVDATGATALPDAEKSDAGAGGGAPAQATAPASSVATATSNPTAGAGRVPSPPSTPRSPVPAAPGPPAGTSHGSALTDRK